MPFSQKYGTVPYWIWCLFTCIFPVNPTTLVSNNLVDTSKWILKIRKFSYVNTEKGYIRVLLAQMYLSSLYTFKKTLARPLLGRLSTAKLDFIHHDMINFGCLSKQAHTHSMCVINLHCQNDFAYTLHLFGENEYSSPRYL